MMFVCYSFISLSIFDDFCRAAAVDVKNLKISGSEAWVSSSNVTLESIDCDPQFGGVLR